MDIYLSAILPQMKKQQNIIGIIDVTRRGVGYIKYNPEAEDAEIRDDFLNTALNGDTVEVEIDQNTINKKGKRVTGKVVRVIKRAQEQFVGVFEKKDGVYFLIPDNKRMYTTIRIQNIHEKVAEGIKALVKLEQWSDPKKSPTGKIIKILGKKGVHEVEMESIVLEQGFDTILPQNVEEEARHIEKKKNITDADIKNRKDLRGIPTFTIDPETAKDFDDALSVNELPDGNIEIGIHIADVSYYVKPDSVIDTEARQRGTSIYLVDRTIPMLPEILSNDVCSLSPNEDKRTFSIIFVISKDGEIKKQWIGETIIRSQKRFTYSEAQKTIDTADGVFYKELIILNNLAHIFRKKRVADGSIAFEQEEIQFELDSSGVPITITKKKLLDTNLLIEDFMLLANRKVAEYFYKLCKDTKRRDLTFVYRIHDVPNEEKIEELSIFLHAIGYELKVGKKNISAKDINKLFKQIEGTPEENLIKTATIRSMAKAVYSTTNIGHFGLSFKYYTHFTSPIRRYPDIMVHRILKSHLSGGTRINDKELKEYEKLAISSSQQEASAIKAERDSIKYKQVEYMTKFVGKTFKGIISGVTEWGIYIEEKETKAEGLVRMRSMRDDYYVFDKKRYRIVGNKTKKQYSLGDTVTVKLIAADVEQRTIDFELA